MLTQQQKLLLKAAAKSDAKIRSKEIDKTIEFIKATNPAAFHHYSEGKPNSLMKDRKFFDEPVTLDINDFIDYEVQYHQGNQKDAFKRRDKVLLKS